MIYLKRLVFIVLFVLCIFCTGISVILGVIFYPIIGTAVFIYTGKMPEILDKIINFYNDVFDKIGDIL